MIAIIRAESGTDKLYVEAIHGVGSTVRDEPNASVYLGDGDSYSAPTATYVNDIGDEVTISTARYAYFSRSTGIYSDEYLQGSDYRQIMAYVSLDCTDEFRALAANRAEEMRIRRRNRDVLNNAITGIKPGDKALVAFGRKVKQGKIVDVTAVYETVYGRSSTVRDEANQYPYVSVDNLIPIHNPRKIEKQLSCTELACPNCGCMQKIEDYHYGVQASNQCRECEANDIWSNTLAYTFCHVAHDERAITFKAPVLDNPGAMPAEAKALIMAHIANPVDASNLLVLADWLDDHGYNGSAKCREAANVIDPPAKVKKPRKPKATKAAV